MHILVCGSRHYTDRSAVQEALLQYWPAYDGRGFTILHGAARGADTLAAQEAEQIEGAVVRAFPADWEQYGRAAGPIRTQEMLGELEVQPARSRLVLAFGQGRGTDFAVAEAERRGITVRRIA